MGEPSIADLAMRLVASLAVVVGLLLLIARGVNKRTRASGGATVQVVTRQALGRGQGVAVVAVGTRVLVLGTTEHQVTLLAEVEPDEVGLGQGDDAAAATIDAAESDETVDATPAVRPVPAATGALAGSLLSPQTWRQAAAAVTRRGASAPLPAAMPTAVPTAPTAVPTDFAAVLADAEPVTEPAAAPDPVTERAS